MPRILVHTVPVCFLVTALLADAGPTVPKGKAPSVGEVKSMVVITVSLAVGSTGREVKRVTYAPPPGWYVRGHRVECKEKTGLSSFTVNTLPREWSFLSEEQVRETYRGMLDVAAKAQNAALGVKSLSSLRISLTEHNRAPELLRVVQ